MKALEAAFNQAEGTMLYIVGDYTTSNFTKDLLRLYYFYLSIIYYIDYFITGCLCQVPKKTCVKRRQQPVCREVTRRVCRCRDTVSSYCFTYTLLHSHPATRPFVSRILPCHRVMQCVCDYSQLVWDISVIYLMRLPNVRSPKLADGPVPCNVFLIMMM